MHADDQIMDIAQRAQVRNSREAFITKNLEFSAEMDRLSRSLALTDGVYSGSLGQWLSLSNVQLIRAANWSRELLGIFEKSPFEPETKRDVQVKAPVAIELTPAGVADFRRELETAFDKYTANFDWSFCSEQYEVLWGRQRMDQVWAAAKEALQWLDRALASLHQHQGEPL